MRNPEFAKPSAAEASGKYEDAIALYRTSSRGYEVLYKLCDADSIRESIASRDLAKWDPSNWSIAEAKFKSSQATLRQDAAASIDSADEALLRYGVTLNTALEYYAGDRKTASETERDRASGIKSQIAVKDEFEAAAALYDQASAAQASKNFESASALYDKAASAFSAAYGHAKAKMDAAKGEIDSLDAAIAAANAAQSR